jgi:hypothetical protein
VHPAVLSQQALRDYFEQHYGDVDCVYAPPSKYVCIWRRRACFVRYDGGPRPYAFVYFLAPDAVARVLNGAATRQLLVGHCVIHCSAAYEKK